MSKPETNGVSAMLKLAIDSHRAGKRAEAERAYQAILGAQPDHAEAHHNLGVLMMQTGRVDNGLAHLKAALGANSREPLYWFSCIKGQLVAGHFTEAETTLAQVRQLGLADGRFDALQNEVAQSPHAAAEACRAALVADPGNAALMDSLGSALLTQGKFDDAIQCYRDALVAAPDFADAHHHLGSALSENNRVAEGFEHYMCRAALVYGKGKAPPSEQADPPHKVKHDLAQRDFLAGGKASTGAAMVGDMFQLTDGDRVDGPAVNPASATPELIQDWRRSSPQMIVINNFLTTPALLKLRAYCAGSTIWRKIYAAGYLGAAPEDGFACPLLAQIVEEIQDTYRSILNGEPFRYLGAFKYDSENCAGTNTHGDNARYNVNLYITPDEANLDPEHGGMEIWDRAAASIDELRRYNGNEATLRDMLRRSGAQATIIPHRSNRAVIFQSTLFHKTDTFTFRSDYLSRRINVSLLFGRFG